MEEKLQQVQDYFVNPIFKEKIENILEEYLDNSRCEFTHYQKNVLPICAAYYAIIEDRERQATEIQMNQQYTPSTPTQQEKDENRIQLKDNLTTISKDEKFSNQQQDDRKHDIQSNSSSCNSPRNENQAKQQSNQDKSYQKVSLIQLRNQFYKKVSLDSLLQTMTDFSQVLKDKAYSEVIQNKLESIKRNYRLFIKFSNVLEYFYSGIDIIQKQLMQRVIWKLYILIKENLHRQHSEEDIEMWAYLLHFICTETLVSSGKTPQCIQNIPLKSVNSVLSNASNQNQMNQIVNLNTLSEQVNVILLNNKLDSSKIKEFKTEFESNLNILFEKIFDSYNQKNKNQGISCQSNTSSLYNAKERPSSQTNLMDEEKENESINTEQKGKNDNIYTSSVQPINIQSQILKSFSSIQDLEKLDNLLEREINQYQMEEYTFLPKKEDLKQQLTTPATKPNSSMIGRQEPPGVTQDYNQFKYQNNHLSANNQQIPKKTLNFNDDTIEINLNSKLSDFERPLPSPQLNIGIQGNQLGLFQQPMTPKTPNELQTPFKMPNNRNQQIQAIIPSTPCSTLLDNCKWFNVYSKSDPTKRIDDLMNKIDKEYKQKVMEEAQNIAREVHYQSKKKNEGAPGSDNAIESKVVKTVSFFQNVLEKMIWQNSLIFSCSLISIHLYYHDQRIYFNNQNKKIQNFAISLFFFIYTKVMKSLETVGRWFLFNYLKIEILFFLYLQIVS